jgi:hypothetical protein
MLAIYLQEGLMWSINTGGHGRTRTKVSIPPGQQVRHAGVEFGRNNTEATYCYRYYLITRLATTSH